MIRELRNAKPIRRGEGAQAFTAQDNGADAGRWQLWWQENRKDVLQAHEARQRERSSGCKVAHRRRASSTPTDAGKRLVQTIAVPCSGRRIRRTAFGSSPSRSTECRLATMSEVQTTAVVELNFAKPFQSEPMR